MRKITASGAVLASIALVFVACTGPGATTAPTPGATQVAPTTAATAAPTEEPTEEPAETEPTETEPTETEPTETEPTATGSPTADFKACEVSDTGGIDDRGFNQNAWEGLLIVQRERGIETKFLESTSDADYDRNIQSFIDEGCDIIVTVGFLLGDATARAAEANPEQLFGIVDFAYDPAYENVTGIVFQMDQPSMMAGYLAAGMSNTGRVATFGGINIPPVAEFMRGFEAGVHYWNAQNDDSVELLGWDSSAGADGTGDGSFVGNFSDTAAGQTITEGFIGEGADVIFAVAGPVGLGAMTAVQDANAGVTDPAEMVKFIGVDVDQAISVAEHANIMLSSVLKRIDNGVAAVVRSAMDGTFEGGVQVNTLANEGTGLAPYHEWEDDVPEEITTTIADMQQQMIDGTLVPADWYTGPPEE